MDHFELIDGPQTPILELFVLEYRIRKARWLSAVGLENFQEDEPTIHSGTWGNVGVNEPQGDPVRYYAVAGWGVLWRLADIARRAVHKAMKTSHGSNMPLSSLTRGAGSFGSIEAAIKEQQLEYINSLPYGSRAAYGHSIVHSMILHVFCDRVFDDPREEHQTGELATSIQ